MKDISATEAARNFSELLDAVEHRQESFVVIRKGRPVARLVAARGVGGAVIKRILRKHSPDRTWGAELHELRSLMDPEETHWNG